MTNSPGALCRQLASTHTRHRSRISSRQALNTNTPMSWTLRTINAYRLETAAAATEALLLAQAVTGKCTTMGLLSIIIIINNNNNTSNKASAQNSLRGTREASFRIWRGIPMDKCRGHRVKQVSHSVPLSYQLSRFGLRLFVLLLLLSSPWRATGSDSIVVD